MMSARRRLSLLCLINLVIFLKIVCFSYYVYINSAYTLTLSNEKKSIARHFSYMRLLMLAGLYTQTTSRCRIQLELETSLGKALIEENGYSLFKINNAA